VTTLAFGLVPDIKFMYPLVAVVGLLGHIAGPAHNAMIADILPEEKRQEGFGILRVVGNLAWIIGPTIGGIIGNYNFFYLFVIDSVISCIVALLLFRLLPETKPPAKVEPHHVDKPESIWQTVLGYRVALKDLPFMAFMLANILMLIVYQQTYGSLSVYLRDVHGIDAQGYGFMMTFGGLLVVLFQLSISRWLRGRPPFAMMALGTLFYMVNFTMFGLVSAYPLFLTAVAINAFGEMIVMPVSQGLAANFAPEDMRGRYMAVFGLSWALPSTVGPGLAGYILDNYNPNLLWYIGGALCAVAAFGFWLLHLKLGKRERFLPKLAEEVN
jgi:MFS family permease